jgi:hypothetical protein
MATYRHRQGAATSVVVLSFFPRHLDRGHAVCAGGSRNDANAASPEQHARYEQYRALLTAEPEWHDGEIVHSHPA